MEFEILSAAAEDRASYERIVDHVTKQDLTPMGNVLWEAIGQYYALDKSAPNVDRLLFLRRLRREYPGREELFTMFEELPELSSPLNLAVEVLSLKRKTAAAELQRALSENEPAESLRAQCEELLELINATDLNRTKLDTTQASLRDLFNYVEDDANRLAMLSAGLPDWTRGMLPGHHTVLFARPEVGKTLYCCDLVRGFLRQGAKTLYLCNEESGILTRSRIASSVVGKSTTAISRNLDKAEALLGKRGFNDLYVIDMAPGTAHEVEGIVQDIKPRVIVLDQIRNMQDGRDDDIVRRLDRLGRKVRGILKRHSICGVSVTQANPPERGKQPKAYHTIDEIDSSKVGLPGHGDLIIGLGATSAMLDNNTRGISIVKNKIPVNGLTNVRGRFMVSIDPLKNRVIRSE